MDECGLGAGDEVFITGLFTKVPGVTQNLPVVRMGNIALVTNELIPHADGLVHAHLVETRSIGGLSGSPVFVRETLGVEYPTRILNKPTPGRETEMLYAITSTYWLFGSMVGHWDIPENSTPLLKEAVNLGISLVVPCDQMLEVLNQPELEERRREHEAARTKQGAVLDTAIKSHD
jgi:hypothetical protein